MTVLDQNLPKVKLSGKEKWLFVGLLCLGVPSAVIFIPLAAVLILPGFLAPFGLMCHRNETIFYGYEDQVPAELER